MKKELAKTLKYAHNTLALPPNSSVNSTPRHGGI